MGFMVVCFLVSILLAVYRPPASFSPAFISLFFLVLLPLTTYISAKRNFTASKRISEPIEYFFDKDDFSVTGESFNSRVTWDKVYKVTETKNWILIWQNRQVATPAPKWGIVEGQVSDLKQILDNHKVKNNLAGGN